MSGDDKYREFSLVDFIICLKENDAERLNKTYDVRRLEDLQVVTEKELEVMKAWASRLSSEWTQYENFESEPE